MIIKIINPLIPFDSYTFYIKINFVVFVCVWLNLFASWTVASFYNRKIHPLFAPSPPPPPPICFCTWVLYWLPEYLGRFQPPYTDGSLGAYDPMHQVSDYSDWCVGIQRNLTYSQLELKHYLLVRRYCQWQINFFFFSFFKLNSRQIFRFRIKLGTNFSLILILKSDHLYITF